MKEKAAKIAFVLTLVVPAAIVLFSGLHGLFFGANGMFGIELSGWDAFYSNAFWTTLVLVIIPVIPLCLVYAIAYLLRRFVKPIREMRLSRYIMIVVIIVVLIAGAVLAMAFSSEIGNAFDKHKAKSMWKKAEQRVDYSFSTHHGSGMMGIDECKYDCVLIDYDTMKLGLIYDASFDGYREYKLKKADGNSAEVSRIKEEYFVNAVIPLSAPMERLVCFYPEDESQNHRTVAFILESEDGVYYVDKLREGDGLYTEYFGFRGCEYFVDGALKYDDIA